MLVEGSPSVLGNHAILHWVQDDFSLVTEQPLDKWDICRRNIFQVTQMTLTFGALLRQDMISEGLAVLVPFSSSFKPLGRTTTGFHFWHRLILRIACPACPVPTAKEPAEAVYIM